MIVRLSDFKSNEYSNLLGGDATSRTRRIRCSGFRGASRYIATEFYDCFALECAGDEARARRHGPHQRRDHDPVRAHADGSRAKCIALLAKNGLERGKNGLRVIMMCEIPSNAILADRFLEYFDGFSIGSNDMTQLTLGVDRDSGGPIAATFDERDDAVKAMLSHGDQACRKADKYVGICGQGRRIIPILRSGWWSRASRACRSIRIRWSRPGCCWPRTWRGRRNRSRAERSLRCGRPLSLTGVCAAAHGSR